MCSIYVHVSHCYLHTVWNKIANLHLNQCCHFGLLSFRMKLYGVLDSVSSTFLPRMINSWQGPLVSMEPGPPHHPEAAPSFSPSSLGSFCFSWPARVRLWRLPHIRLSPWDTRLALWSFLNVKYTSIQSCFFTMLPMMKDASAMNFKYFPTIFGTLEGPYLWWVPFAFDSGAKSWFYLYFSEQCQIPYDI